MPINPHTKGVVNIYDRERGVEALKCFVIVKKFTASLENIRSPPSNTHKSL